MPKLMTAPTGQGLNNTYWMLTEDNQVGAFEVDGSTLTNELQGEHLMEIVGYTDEFTYTSQQYGEKLGIKLLLDVVSGEDQGARLAIMVGYALGERAHLRHIIEAARKAPIEPGEEVNFDDLLGLRLFVMVKSEQSAKGYMNTYYKACREYVERKPKAAANGATAAPAAKAPAPRAARPAAAPAASDDPFDADDEA